MLGALLAACVALGACGEDAVAPAPENVAMRERRPATLTPDQQQELAQQQQRLAEVRRAPRPPDPYDSLPTAAPEPEAAAVAEQEKPRDYSAELLSGMRGAESCVKPRLASEALPSELAIALEGLVLESGTVVTGAARAAMLTPEELECVKRRLESTRLPPNVKEAPRRVHATLTLKFKKQEPAAQPGVAPAPPTPSAPPNY